MNYIKLDSSNIKELEELVRLYERVFEMKDFKMPEAHYLQTLLTKDYIIFYVAVQDDGRLAGGLTAYSMPSVYYAAPEVYIYDLAVDIAHQRKGIGIQLITELKSYCAALGCKYVFVQADLADQHAIDFYRATGGVREDVVHFDYVLRD